MSLGQYLGLAALGMETFAFVVLASPIPSNSALWFPLNVCYVGGIFAALAAAISGLPALLKDRTFRSALPLALALAAVLLNRLAAYR
jgi:hypothetical protein